FEVPAEYQKTSLAGFGLGAMGGAVKPGGESEAGTTPAAPPQEDPSEGGGMGGALKEVGKGLKGLLKW
ncbi:MAG: hypothetical protein IH608_05620, partial [Proteobacteria bacterium]|nr:hypothetical protein [Pseudomonadota bacterium]